MTHLLPNTLQVHCKYEWHDGVRCMSNEISKTRAHAQLEWMLKEVRVVAHERLLPSSLTRQGVGHLQ